MNLIPIVLSGGSGTRLWPMSRTSFPKQFCKLLNESLQTLTLKRLKSYEPSVIITSDKLASLTHADISENNFSVDKIILEPAAKNTAAAIAVACRYLELKGLGNEVVGVFSSDALVLDEPAFHKAVEVAKDSAVKNKIAILGIRPDRVETGFGYIQVSSEAKLNAAVSVLKFHEKPNYELADSFVKSGNYFWNAGIFIFKVSAMIQLFKIHQPEIWMKVQAYDGTEVKLKEIYSELKSISIDFAIIEKLSSENLICVPCDIGWSDLGSWDVMDQITSQTLAVSTSAANNFVKPFEVESRGNSVFSSQKKTYGVVGLDDVMIVDTADALLVCRKGESQKVKILVDQIKEQIPEVIESANFEVRPWGRFEILKEEDYFKSKVIQVKPGQKISYQSHQFRSEHWILVKGSAVVILNDEEHLVKQGQHIFIPQGAKHRIINSTKSMVEFIEVQVGSSFAEDDITRYQDDYGR